ncbi:MAG: hypothetical protein ABIY37_11510 [Devosia sp.]
MTGQDSGNRADTESHGEAVLDLGRQLVRHRSRAQRAWRQYQGADETGDPIATQRAHQLWSEAIDDALDVAEAISRQRSISLADLVVQYEAIWWWVREDDNVLDCSTRRWLGRFRRALRRLAAER